MERYRYFIFNQRGMIPLGILQIACSTVCVACGLIDGFFRKDSVLRRTRIPIWTGMALAFPGILALFSSQKKNPILEYILSKFVQGANMVILIASVVGILMATIIAYLGCRSLPICGCYDSTTGMQPLMTEDHQPQMIELVSRRQGGSAQRILNDPAQYDGNGDTEEPEMTSKLAPYVQLA